MRWLTEKDVLRRAMRGVLPDEIRRRRKRGTLSPVDAWMRSPVLPEPVADALSPARLTASGYFVPAAVREMLERQRAGVGASGRTLLLVAGVQVIHELFVGGRSAPERPRFDDDAL